MVWNARCGLIEKSMQESLLPEGNVEVRLPQCECKGSAVKDTVQAQMADARHQQGQPVRNFAGRAQPSTASDRPPIQKDYRVNCGRIG